MRLILRCAHRRTHLSHYKHISLNLQFPRSHKKHTLCAFNDDIEDVPSIQFPPLSTPQLDQEQQWISNMVRLWLDEEWTPLDIHKDLGDAAGNAYISQRLAGSNEAGDVLLGLSSDLLAFNYRDTFVNGFEVANKVIELLMLRQGCDVCCTSESDRNAIYRYEKMLQEEQEQEQEQEQEREGEGEDEGK